MALMWFEHNLHAGSSATSRTPLWAPIRVGGDPVMVGGIVEELDELAVAPLGRSRERAGAVHRFWEPPTFRSPTGADS